MSVYSNPASNLLLTRYAVIGRLSLTFTANGKGKNKTFAVCLQLSVQ